MPNTAEGDFKHASEQAGHEWHWKKVAVLPEDKRRALYEEAWNQGFAAGEREGHKQAEADS